jgi:hypothetical protein
MSKISRALSRSPVTRKRHRWGAELVALTSAAMPLESRNDSEALRPCQRDPADVRRGGAVNHVDFTTNRDDELSKIRVTRLRTRRDGRD